MKKEIASQYRAALTMLTNSIDRCPEPLWDDRSYASPFWQIAYHSMYYTDLFLTEREDTFAPWAGYRDRYHWLGRIDSLNISTKDIYQKTDLMAYVHHLDQMIELEVKDDALTATSGFEWLTMSKFEMHLYNMRHLQHHTGQLVERLHQHQITGLLWVSVVG